MTLRAFILGDYLDPVMEQVEQDEAVNYTASIKVYYYNPVTEQKINQTYPMTPGTSRNIDVASGYEVTLICAANSGFKFDSAANTNGTKIAFTDSAINYVFPDSALTSALTGGREILITTAAAKVTPNFSTGDTVDASGAVSQTGDALYSAKIVTETDDPVTEQTTTKEYALPLGSLVPVEVEDANRVYFRATVNEGYDFAGASYAGNNIAFTANAIDYQLTTAQLRATDDNQRAFYIQCKQDEPTPQPSDSFINLYNPTVAEYTELQKQVYASADPTSTTTKPWEFISSAIELPFTLPASVIGLQENLKAGSWTYNLMNRVLDPIFTVELGELEITPKHGNALDYFNVNIDLYLPFRSGSVDLDPNLVMGKKLRLEYRIVGTDGNITANVYADDVLVSVTQFSVGVSVPFYSFYNTVAKTYEPNSVNNGVFAAYVIIQWPDYGDAVTPTVEVQGELTGVTGRVTVNEIEIDDIPYSDEYDLIISLLRSGVFIKEV